MLGGGGLGGKELLIVAIVRMHRSTKDVWCVLFTDCQKKLALPPRLNERTTVYCSIHRVPTSLDFLD